MAGEFRIRPYHIIDFKIGKMDLSHRLTKIETAASVMSLFQYVILEFDIDQKNAILEKIYGQEEILLTIHLMTENMTILETIQYDLLCLNPKMDLTLKSPSDKPDHPQSGIMKITCVVRNAYNTMMTEVNKLIEDRDKKTPLEAIQAILNDFSKVETDIKDKNANKEKIYQMIIPPMPLYKAVQYIDKSFGVFDGPLFQFCRKDVDGEKFQMWDLSKAMEDNEHYQVNFLTLGGDQQEEIKDTGSDDFHFYTREPVKQKYRGNEGLMLNSFRHSFISKPNDDLYHVVETTMEDIFNQNATTDGEKKMYINDLVKNRHEVHNRHFTGYEKTDNFAKSFLSRKISNLSEIEIKIDRNTRIANLTKLGIPIMLKMFVPEYTELQGKYVVSGYALTFNREAEQNFTCRARIKCFRGNINH